jgi:hypothetical protein
MSKFRRDTLISVDWKCKSSKKCVELEQAEKIDEDIL